MWQAPTKSIELYQRLMIPSADCTERPDKCTLANGALNELDRDTMIITLSPSKGQDFTQAAHSKTHTLPAMREQSQLLIDELRSYDVAAIRSLMSVSENIAALNVERFQSFDPDYSKAKSKQAIFAFKGDVYTGIDSDHYDETTLAFAQAHVRILSGLYGYLRPLDLIQAYRLEMKTRLSNPRGDTLYSFWDDRITEALNADLGKQKEPTLVNLASTEYFKSIKPKLLEGRLLTLNFKEEKDGAARVIAIFAKTRARFNGGLRNQKPH